MFLIFIFQSVTLGSNMKNLSFNRIFASAALTLVAFHSGAQAADPPRESVVPAFAYPIANVPGKSVTALTVVYPPGGKTPPHRHGRSFVVAYVLEGQIRSQLDNGEVRIYKAGESWTEKPGAHHVLSENASSTEPAKVLAMLIANTNAKDLLTFDSDKNKKKP
jgi:quercetin dioxygenase-like cupin family protein